MATRLYFHNAPNALPGAFPSGEQSVLVPNWVGAGANTLRRMDTTKGVLQASMVGASQASLTEQNGFCGFFCSDTFIADQVVGGGGQTVTLNIANSMNGTMMALGGDLRFNVYVWRPSTGAIVGTVGDAIPLTGDAIVSNTTERVNQGTTVDTVAVNALAGDVLICEVWQIHTQLLAVSRNGTFYYDGTVVTTVTNTFVGDHASFLEFSADNLTFGTLPSAASAGHGKKHKRKLAPTGDWLVTTKTNVTTDSDSQTLEDVLGFDRPESEPQDIAPSATRDTVPTKPPVSVLASAIKAGITNRPIVEAAPAKVEQSDLDLMLILALLA